MPIAGRDHVDHGLVVSVKPRAVEGPRRSGTSPGPGGVSVWLGGNVPPEQLPQSAATSVTGARALRARRNPAWYTIGTETRVAIATCPHCGTNVHVGQNNTCPSCLIDRNAPVTAENERRVERAVREAAEREATQSPSRTNAQSRGGPDRPGTYWPRKVRNGLLAALAFSVLPLSRYRRLATHQSPRILRAGLTATSNAQLAT